MEHFKHRALVVDDDEAIRVMVSRILEREKFEVDCAKDGFDAIECIREHDYQLIVLDIMMPRIDGLGVVRYLRAHKPHALPRVLAISAFIPERWEEPSVRLLPKPFDISELIEHARNIVAVAS